MKSAVYSWRVSPETKAALEDEARQRGQSIAELLERIATEWLALERNNRFGEQEWEARTRERALRACGTIAGGDPHRSVRARDEIRRRLRANRGRQG